MRFLFFLTVGIIVLMATGIMSVTWEGSEVSIHFNRDRARAAAHEAREKAQELGAKFREEAEQAERDREYASDPSSM